MFYLDEKVKERYSAWWECELLDRVMIQVYAPKKGSLEILEKYERCKNRCKDYRGNFTSFKLIKEWKDSDFNHHDLINKIKEVLSLIYYSGDAFPMFYPNMGPGSLAAYLGCDTEFREDTVWFHPLTNNKWEELKNIKIDSDNIFWKKTKELTELAANESNGKYAISSTNLCMGLDTIASLRGMERLLLDLIEYPEEVKKLNRALTKKFIYCYEELYRLVKNNQKLFLGWQTLYCDGKTYPVQCDFSALISPKMFENFVVPELAKIANSMDKTIFHLDGPDVAKHLDIILNMPEIDAIEWEPGAGAPPAVEWIPMLKKIQKKKKALRLYSNNMRDIEKLILELDPSGLLVVTDAESEEQADEVAKQVERLSQKSRKGNI